MKLTLWRAWLKHPLKMRRTIGFHLCNLKQLVGGHWFFPPCRLVRTVKREGALGGSWNSVMT